LLCDYAHANLVELKLKKLRIRNFRNISELELDCDRGIHFIHGQNAQGKTTILEAISILSQLRSFRDSDLSSVLQHGQQKGFVQANFELEPATEATLKVELERGLRFEKRAYINHKLARSAVDYYGVKKKHSPIQFHAIALNPTSTDLIRGEPALRRNYLNQVISSESPEHLDQLKRYQKVVDQKNALLKPEKTAYSGASNPIDLQLLRILNENIASLGALILAARFDYLRRISGPVSEFLQKIAPHQQPIFLAYKNGDKSTQALKFHRHFEPATVKILEANLHQKLEEWTPQERIRKTSLIGPHRDDLSFLMGANFETNTEGKSFSPDAEDSALVDVGSQGEIRSTLLSLKLAELEEFQKVTKVQPILMIDDFSSELDSTRRGFLLNYLKDSDLQIFVTSTEALDSPGKMIQMNRGWIT
jgi:DNA replication and repair protein RecF